MCKILCAIHNLSAAFNIYLDISQWVQCMVDEKLDRNGPNWQLLHSCPPCNYKVHDKPHLVPAWLQAMDGNMSLKCIDGSGHMDEQVFISNYHIPVACVNQFKDEASLCGNDETICTDNWTTTNAVSEETTHVFEQTGGFVSACCHGLVQTFVEMRKNGELAKYGLATIDRILSVYGNDQGVGCDIACSFASTVQDSSLGERGSVQNLIMALNSFHRYAHGHSCQLRWHPLFLTGLGLEDLETCEHLFSASNTVARLVRHGSYFHYLQFIDLFFQQWDDDKYADLSKFIYNNYKQATSLIADYLPEVEAFQAVHGYMDAAFHSWHQEEVPEENVLKIGYVEALQKLDHANKLELAMNVTEDLERHLGIQERWTPEHPEFRHVLTYLNQQLYIRAVNQLEGLVVARLFELAKANLMGTCYKMHQHISKAITKRSSAICTALEKYNALAPLQNPPRPQLQYGDVAGYGMLADFELLKHSDTNLLAKPWSVPANRLVASKFFKIVHAQEEIVRLNVETRQLLTWVDDEDRHLWRVGRALQTTEPALAQEIQSRYMIRHRVNNVHQSRLHGIMALPGYTGHRTAGTHIRMSDGTHESEAQPVAQDNGEVREEMEGQEMDIVDDDIANDEVLHLGDFLENTHVN
ncbi:hypothetical protein K439DRAFT_1647970 [Ramaria rubella]|nr:hypothetical protein K439DRAFT_1647970 [Ramaria rubella]